MLDPDPLGGASADAPLESAGAGDLAVLALGARSLSIRLAGLESEEADRVEAELRKVGGAIAPAANRSAFTLLATGTQCAALGAALRAQSAAFPAIADRIDQALRARFWRSNRLVKGLHRSFRVGGQTVVMGVVNVTPDSFFDGGQFLEPEAAVAHAVRLAGEGAGLIDVGGESTRPGAPPVAPEAEWRRVGPVIERLHGRLEVPISIDTRHAEVAARALEAGADLVNDVAGLRDPAMRRVLARAGAPVIVMHMRGEPGSMQSDLRYADLRGEVFEALADACALAESDGLAPEQLLIDPGLGFGKGPEQNFELIAHLGEFRSLGYPLVIGASRKSFLGWALGGAPPDAREAAGIAAAVAAALRGADVVRTHDVRPTVQALAIADRLRGVG